MKILVFISILIKAVLIEAGERGSGEVSYRINIKSGVAGCPEFENKQLAANLDVQNDDDFCYWLGDLNLLDEITDGMTMTIQIYKLNEDGDKEFFSEMKADICQSMKEDDAPWTPVVEAMGLSGCPIPVKSYPINNLTLSLGAAKDGLTREFCSDYWINVSLETAGGQNGAPESVACFFFTLTIMEVKE